MSAAHPELLIIAVALVALALAPLASHLVGQIGEKVSGELDGGRSGEELTSYLDSSYELSGGSLRDEEIRQMQEARSFLRGGPVDMPVPAADPELAEEVRQLVVASNERRERQGLPPLDVDAETVRRLAEVLRPN